jgi:hypothetical protein
MRPGTRRVQTRAGPAIASGLTCSTRRHFFAGFATTLKSKYPDSTPVQLEPIQVSGHVVSGVFVNVTDKLRNYVL